MNLQLQHVSVSYDKKMACSDVSLSLQSGDWLTLLGPNGAGKSSLVRAIAGTVPFEGSITLDGQSLLAFRPRVRAQKIGMLEQLHNAPPSFTVRQMVALGRYPYTSRFFLSHEEGQKNEESIQRALAYLGLLEMENKKLSQLSGGEIQRVFLAQLFAQEPRVFILDEPMNHLDLHYQKEFFDFILFWIKQTDVICISVMHNLTLARRYGNKALLMNEGKIVCFGSPEEVFSSSRIDRVYGMDLTKWMRENYRLWVENEP